MRTISDIFESNEIEHIPLPDNMVPSGQRRGLVERFYASIDWADCEETRRVLSAYEDAMLLSDDPDDKALAKLVKCLERDGYRYINERIVSASSGEVLKQGSLSVSLDTEHLDLHIARINGAADTDPALAIGSTKELIEATLKTILTGLNIAFDDRREDLPTLLKKVQKGLDLVPAEVDEAKRGADTIKKVLSNLGAIAIGVAELRNLYGTGHGKGTAARGLTPRHAKLVAASGAALCRFLLETFELREGDEVR